MIERVINSNFKFLYFAKQKEFFQTYENLIAEGYRFVSRIHLAVLLEKDQSRLLLSYISVPAEVSDPIEYLKKQEKSYKLVHPNYQQGILNIISSIRKYYGKKPNYKCDEIIDKYLEFKPRKIVIMLIDGLGENILYNNLPEESFLRRQRVYTNTAIYPSTTAAATTATKSGLSPRRTSWLGWENYFQEVDKNLILFTGKDYFTDEPSNLNTYSIIPFDYFYADLPVLGQCIEPDFTKEFAAEPLLARSLEELSKGENVIQYLYFSEPDGVMHDTGAYSSETKAVLAKLNTSIEEYAAKLPKDTLLIMTADHGHHDVSRIEFYDCDYLLKMLKRPPANDSRCLTFTVKAEYKDVFCQKFSELFGYAYEIYPSKKLLDAGFFGLKDDPLGPKTLEFLGDFTAVATNDYYLNYKGELAPLMKSHHAGITADEMLIPVCIYRKF